MNDTATRGCSQLNRLKVRPTQMPHRTKLAKGDYIACIHEDRKKILGISKFVVVTYAVRFRGDDNVRKALLVKGVEDEQVLKVHALVVPVRREEKDEKQMVGEGEIRVDQSIRNAIGIPYTYGDEFVEVYPVTMGFYRYLVYLARYHIARMLGVRYLFYRVCSADPHDMEKEICRVPLDTFPILGTDVSSKLVYEAPVKKDGELETYEIRTRSISSFELTRENLERREKKEREPEIRYRNPESWFDPKLKPDISRVFMDSHDCGELGLKQLFPVKARRDLFDLAATQVLGIVLSFFVTILSLGTLLPGPMIWERLMSVLLGGLLVAGLLTVALIRRRIRWASHRRH